MKLWTGRILVVFAIFTLGYGLGRQSGLARGGAGGGPVAAPGEDKVLVYYLHTTFRCVTCNGIERLARQVVDREFAAELAAGKVEWHEINFQERDDLARQYEVAASVVVVAKIEDGRETGYRRLDDVWTLGDQPDKFAEYVGGAIRDYLQEMSR